MKIGVHQGSALSLLLFILVMEEATRKCRKSAPWEMLYADDLVVTAVSEDEDVYEMERCDGVARVKNQYKENKIYG